jgi:hypothetical protein
MEPIGIRMRQLATDDVHHKCASCALNVTQRALYNLWIVAIARPLF